MVVRRVTSGRRGLNLRSGTRRAIGRLEARRPALLGAAAFALVVGRLAWVSDDAAITVRVITNTLSGFGPNYNITERAQAFTHPAWFLLNTAVSAVTGRIILTMLLLSIACAAATAYALLRERHWVTVLVLTVAMCSTYAMTEYGASGLENPLAWLLLVLMWRCARQGRPLAAAIAAGLLVLTRLDLALVALPFMTVWLFRRPPSRRLQLLAAAAVLVPVVAWSLFSWLYYGSPLPETAYAKLNTAIPQRELVAQGLRYALDLTQNDPLAALLILGGLAAALSSRVSLESRLLVGGGIILYGAYIVWVGGDFMVGRFWTVPLVAALVAIGEGLDSLLDRHPLQVDATAYAVVVLLAAVVLPSLLNTRVEQPALRDPIRPQPRAALTGDAAGIIDEWTYYVAQGRGLTQWLVQDPYDNVITRMNARLATWGAAGQVNRVGVNCGGVGLEAVESGPEVHWVVSCGLADPFLARIEFAARDRQWRVGHYEREIPPGYLEALASGSADRLAPELRELFAEVSVPRRVPERWAPDPMLP